MPIPSDLVIGAVIALSGVLFAQIVAMLQSWLDRINKREILLRTKYEEFGLYVLASMHLTEALLTCASHEETLTVTHQTDGNKARLLALVYFPLLLPAIAQYVESYAALCSISIALYDPQNKKMLGMQIYDKPEYIQARNAHLAAREYLHDQIKLHSVTYAKS